MFALHFLYWLADGVRKSHRHRAGHLRCRSNGALAILGAKRLSLFHNSTTGFNLENFVYQ